MRKKNLEELKASIKKDIINEMNKEKEKDKKRQEVVVPVKEPVLYHSKEELHDIQKSFLKIFLFSVAILFIIIVIFIVDPFSNKKKPVQESMNVEIDNTEEESLLINRADGIIENTNKEMLELFNLLKFSNEEYYIYDSTYLYSKEELLLTDIPDSYLLFLMSKSNQFKELIDDTGLLTKIEVCNKDGSIRIPEEKVDEIIKELFNRDTIQHEEFIYTYYVDNAYSTYIKFVYSDGYYVSICEDRKELPYNSVSIPVISEAVKGNGELRIKVKVAFATKDKVYSDYSLQNVISNHPNLDVLDYIQNASSYEYVFKQSNNRFVLDKIVK